MQVISELSSHPCTNCCPTVRQPEKGEPKQLDSLFTKVMDVVATLKLRLIAIVRLALPWSEGSLRLGSEAYDKKLDVC